MSVTWTVALPRLRTAYLKDPLGKKWDDDVLLTYCNRALADLSGHVPMPKSYTLVAATGIANAYTLPDDLHSIEAVIWPTGLSVANGWDRSGVLVYPEAITAESDISYLLDWPNEGLLTLTCIPPGAVTLYYGAYRPVVTAFVPVDPPVPLPPDYEAPVESPLPFGRYAWMEGALCSYIAMLAHLREGVTTAMLEQFKVKNDLNVGNPLNAEAREWWIQYYRIVTENAPK